jgi:hypothetical protein
MYILDSILKNVQGDYINFFEEQIHEAFVRIFRNSTIEEKRSLIKMFKIWVMFFDEIVLEKISVECQLVDYVSKRLITY